MRIYLILILLLIPLGYALEECQDIITPNDIPCIITSTWEYPNLCNTYEVKIYESQGLLLETKNLDAIGIYCNFTIHNSTIGSYYYNVSSGDTGAFIIKNEGDNMISLGVILFLMVITAVVFYFGFKGGFTNSELANFIISRSLILGGIFLLMQDITILATLSDHFGLGINKDIFRLLWLSMWGGYLFAVYLLFNTFIGALKLARQEQEKRRMGEI